MVNSTDSRVSDLASGSVAEMIDWELTEAGADPDAMIRCSIEAMNDKEKGGFYKAFDIMRLANALYPDNLEVKVKYLDLLFMSGHISRKIGAKEQAYEHLKQCVGEFDLLRAKGLIPKGFARRIEGDACMELGEMEYDAGNYLRAFELLERTDLERHPFAAVLCVTMHMDYPSRYSREIADEVAFLARAIDTDHWRTPFERAAAYYMLSCILATGVPNGVRADVNRAWSYIQKCAEIDPEMAQTEISKYSRKLFGKIVYRG